MTARRVVAVLVAALAIYFVIIGYRGVYLLGQPQLTLKVLGLAVLVLPLVGSWVVVAELRFGRATERLAAMLDASGEPADDPLPRTSAGRVDRAAADALFERRRDEAQAAPEDWRSWYRLALAYDLAGDRRRAREAMRTAIDHAEP